MLKKGIIMKGLFAVVFLGLGIFLYAFLDRAETVLAAAIPQGNASHPVVVELFTSQGCYSCPPAEKFLGELAMREDIIALEYHVDYWDDLNYLWKGVWKDLYSDPAFTQRQYRYNEAIRDELSVYTPQMIVDGAFQSVGSRRNEVGRNILQAAMARNNNVMIQTRTSENALHIKLTGSPAAQTPDLKIYLVQFKDQDTTHVTSGENKGKKLTSHHIVTDISAVTNWAGGTFETKISPAPKHQCAVLVQPPHGKIIAAAYCK